MLCESMTIQSNQITLRTIFPSVDLPDIFCLVPNSVCSFLSIFAKRCSEYLAKDEYIACEGDGSLRDLKVHACSMPRNVEYAVVEVSLSYEQWKMKATHQRHLK